MASDGAPLKLPCGGTAYFDHTSNIYAYTCTTCLAVVGSMSQLHECQKESDKWQIIEKLGGQGWDYDRGCQQEITEEKEIEQ